MTLRDSAAQARALAFWRGVPVGTRVTARRDDGRHLETFTASEATQTSGLAVIRLQAIPGDYPLDHVSFGWGKPTVAPPQPVIAPAVTVAAALEPAPNLRSEDSPFEGFALAMALCVVMYFVGLGLLAILQEVLG